MVKALFDTNILIDYLRGIPAAAEELARFKQRAISTITWMEVLVGTSAWLEQQTERFLAGFPLAALRRAHWLKLPDAIVWASAQVHGMLLVTLDTKGFPADDPGVRVPYLI